MILHIFHRFVFAIIVVLMCADVSAAAVQPASTSSTRIQLADGHWLEIAAAGNAGSGNKVWLDDGSEAASLLRPRREHTATLMPDGRVFIWGGVSVDGRIVADGEWFDPRTRKSSLAGAIDLLPRAGHAAMLLVDGRLLMIGGRATGIAAVTRIEAWDIRRNRSDVLPQPLPVAMRPITAQLVSGGRVRLSSPSHPEALLFDPAAPNVELTWERHPVSEESNPVQASPASSLNGAAGSPADDRIVLTASNPTVSNQAVPLGTAIGLQFTMPVATQFWNDNPPSLIGPRGQEAFTLVPAGDGLLLFVTPKQELLPASTYTVVFGSKGMAGVAPGLIEFRTERVQPSRPDTRVSNGDHEALLSNDTAARVEAPDVSTDKTAPSVQIVGEGGHALRKRRIADQFRFTEAPGNDLDFWIPTAENLDSQWRTNRTLNAQVREQLALGMSRNQREKAWRSKTLKSSGTSASGVIYSIGDKPLANVTVSLGAQTVRTDAQGRYWLSDFEAGRQQLVVDGRSVKSGEGESFGQFVIGFDAESGKETPISPIHLPKIRTQDWIEIESPLRSDITIRTPLMPGFSVHLPKGTVLRDREGKVVRRIAIIPVPLDRAPINYPVNTPLHMSFQPAGLQVEGLTPGVTPGIRFVYPNYSGAAPGRVADFLNYDPIDKGWYAYGTGRVSNDGLYVVPDAGTEIYKATGFGISFGADMPPLTPTNCGATGADPVDLRTGLFLHHAAGAHLNDRVPAAINTTYRPGDSVSRDFGKGVFHGLGHYIYKLNSGAQGAAHFDWNVIWMVLPDCSKIPFRRTSPQHTSYPYPYADFRAINDEVQGAWFGAEMIYTDYGLGGVEYWTIEVTRRDGEKLKFSLFGGHLLSRSDRVGNRVELVRVGGALTRITGPSGRHLDLTTGTSARVSTIADMGGRSWQYTYDASGRLTRITYPDNSFEQYVYDTNGRMQEVWDRRGNRMVLNQYDANGRVIHQTLSDGGTHQLAYTTANGTITETQVTDPDGSTRRVRFHSSGYPSEETEALGTGLERSTYFERNTLGLLQAVVDPLARRTEYTYDSQQRMTGITVLAGTPQALTSQMTYNAYHDPISSTDPEGHVTTYVWDARRRLEKVIDYRQREVRMDYDTLDRVTSVTDPQQRVTQFGYQLYDLVSITDHQGRMLKRYVDALGRTLSITDQQGRTAKLEYDNLDRVVVQRAADGAATHFSYDPMGNLKTLTDANFSVTRWDYDTRQRPILRTDALGQEESWSYDDVSRYFTHTDRQSRATTYRFDELGRLELVDLSDGEPIQQTYDAGDRLLTIGDYSGTISYGYDLLDNVTSETTDSGTIEYQYDAVGRRIRTAPSGHPYSTYSYDTFGRLRQIKRMTGGSVTFEYDAQDRRTKVRLPNGTEQRYSYGTDDRLDRIEYRNAGGTLIGDLNYGFDESGQLITRTGSFANDLLPQAVGPAAFNANHQLEATADRIHTYDISGNLVSDISAANAHDLLIYTYDARDRLTEIGGNLSAEFRYDVLGRRTYKRTAGEGTDYRYDGGNVVAESNGYGVTSTYLNGLGLDERYGRQVGEEPPFGSIGIPPPYGSFLTDALGSTLALQDANGAWQAKYQYTPYGETEAQAFDGSGAAIPPGPAADAALATLNNPFQYTGRENDGNGLYYYRARYYSPKLGRFTQEDPLGLGDGPNPYAYVHGDPISRTDPTGLMDSLRMACMQDPQLCLDLFVTIADAYGAVQAKHGNYCQSEYYFALGSLYRSLRPAAGVAEVALILAPGGASGAARRGKTFFHYTDSAGANGIAKTGVIRADRKGKLFITDQKLSPSEVKDRLFIGNAGDKGSHVVEIRVADGLPIRPGKNPNEFIHNGSIRHGRQADLRVKPNDF